MKKGADYKREAGRRTPVSEGERAPVRRAKRANPVGLTNKVKKAPKGVFFILIASV